MNTSHYLHSFKLSLVILFTVMLAACSSPPKKTVVESDLGLDGVPKWVNKGTNILNDQNGRLFHGVGSAVPMANMGLQKSVADDRARAEVARILDSYMEVVSDDYVASARAGGENVSEESITRQIRATTKVNLRGSQIIASWRHPKTGVIYSLCELNLDRVKSTVDSMKQMNADLRRYIKKNGENVFDRVAGEIK